MKKLISVVALTSLCAAGSAMASGYRIPEQSLDSTAKSGANIASASSADVTYFNPAGMSLLDDAWHLEGTATYLHLTAIDYDDNLSSARDGSTETENFLLPTFFLVSPDYNNFRFGFSVTETYGLAKRWYDDMFPRASANKFSLQVFELNPTVSYKFSDMFSLGGGVRMLYSKATLIKNSVEYNSTLPFPASIQGSTLGMSGDTTEWGYNLAADFKPNDSWNFALTYRSNVDLDFEDGDVRFTLPNWPLGVPPFFGPFATDTTGNVSVPAPAVLSFSTAYTVAQWTFDLTIDRTFWSEYEELAFTFATAPPPDTTFPKNWDDTTCVRLGAEYRLNEKFTLMGGIAYDENPVPEETAGFELPDSDAWLFSAGVRYKHSERLEYGVSALYDYKQEREIVQGTGVNDINGEFSNAAAFLVSFGMSYKF